jgi:hypothetical protein
MLSLLGLKELVLSKNTDIYQLDDASSSEPDQRSKSFCWFGDSRHRVLTLVYGRSAALHWHTCPGCVAVFSIPVLTLVQSSARRPLVSSFHHHNRALRRCIQIPSLELLSANQIFQLPAGTQAAIPADPRQKRPKHAKFLLRKLGNQFKGRRRYLLT